MVQEHLLQDSVVLPRLWFVQTGVHWLHWLQPQPGGPTTLSQPFRKPEHGLGGSEGCPVPSPAPSARPPCLVVPEPLGGWQAPQATPRKEGPGLFRSQTPQHLSEVSVVPCPQYYETPDSGSNNRHFLAILGAPGSSVSANSLSG